MITRIAAFMAAFIFVSACNNNTEKKSADTDTKKDSMNIKDETVMYSSDSAMMDGYVFYDTRKQEKRPILFLLREWWGEIDNQKRRARKLAELDNFALPLECN